MLNLLAQHANKVKYLINSNSPTLLTAVGVGGTVATAVLTGKATFKAAEIIERETLDMKENVVFRGVVPQEHADTLDLSRMNKIRYVWHLYIPPVVAGGLTVSAIVMANRISAARLTAVLTAAGVSERALQEYKDKIVEKLGDKQSTAVNDEIAQDRVDKNPPTHSAETLVIGNGDILAMDSISGRYFFTTVEKIRAAENRVNMELIHFDSCSLSHFYDELGLAPTTFSDMVGWNLGNKLDLSFSTVITPDQKPCLVINFAQMPSMDYNRYQDG